MWWALALALSCGPVTLPPAGDLPGRVDLNRPLLIYGLGLVADRTATWAGERNGSLVEVNPLMRGGGAALATSVVATGAMVWADVELQRSGRHGWARACRIVITGVRAGLVIRALHARP
jgi:hypothetical protein